ncbi:MAG TPA: YCF48-related protein [Kofleriaceae bacterium]|nr:YCF48-related protein [Kofleriaceae bacterium]
MRFKLAILLCMGLAATGCKKTGTGGGGGGGGGWLVGRDALMQNIASDDSLGKGYDLGATETLYGIACRYQGEAWVVGAHGSLLYTDDAGATWVAQTVPTAADLHTLATQDNGPVYVAGDGVFLTTTDTGKTWTSIGDSAINYRSLAAAQEGDTVLTLSDDGRLFSYANGALTQRGTFAGGHALAISPDGQSVLLVGNGIHRSSDGGVTWTDLTVDPSINFEDVRIGEDGSGVAVGAGGAIAKIDVSGQVLVQHVGSADLHALHIADVDAYDSTGYAVGQGGQVLITHDGGWTWAVGPNVGRDVFGVDEIGFGHR